MLPTDITRRLTKRYINTEIRLIAQWLQKKAAVWGLQNWLHEAQELTRRFYSQGPEGPTTWVLVHGTQIPEGAIPGGDVSGNPLFIARMFVENTLRE